MLVFQYHALKLHLFIKQLALYPCVQTGSRLPGTVWRGLIFFTTDCPDYHRMPPPAGDNHGWVVFAVLTGFALGHRASTFHACAHLITTAVLINYEPKVAILSPNPTFRYKKSRRASTRWDCRGKSCLETFPAKRDPVWTQGMLKLFYNELPKVMFTGFLGHIRFPV